MRWSFLTVQQTEIRKAHPHGSRTMMKWTRKDFGIFAWPWDRQKTWHQNPRIMIIYSFSRTVLFNSFSFPMKCKFYKVLTFLYPIFDDTIFSIKIDHKLFPIRFYSIPGQNLAYIIKTVFSKTTISRNQIYWKI